MCYTPCAPPTHLYVLPPPIAMFCLTPTPPSLFTQAACKARLPAAHAQLLSSYLTSAGVSSLSDIADDGYIVNNAGYHLVGAGHMTEMRVCVCVWVVVMWL